MAVDKNIIKLAAIAVVGGVAKSLLSEPRPVFNQYNDGQKSESVEIDLKGDN